MKKHEINHYADATLYQVERSMLSFKTYAAKFFRKLNIGITSEQFSLLDTIYCNPGISQKELSQLSLKYMSNATRILNVLEEKDLIYKKVGFRKNYLVKELFVTSKGNDMIENNIKQIRKIFDVILKDFEEEEVIQFKNLAIRLQKTCDENCV